MKKAIAIIIFGLIILQGCMFKGDKININKSNCISEIMWSDFSEEIGTEGIGFLNDSLREPSLLLFYFEGLKHSNPNIRWYSAYKMIEFTDHEKKDAMIEMLEALLEDPEEHVKDAATFSLSAINKTFEGADFIKSLRGDVAFTRYNEIRYNNGEVWIYRRDIDAIYLLKNLDGSINSIKWSEDFNKLIINYGGRTWDNSIIIEVE